MMKLGAYVLVGVALSSLATNCGNNEKPQKRAVRNPGTVNDCNKQTTNTNNNQRTTTPWPNNGSTSPQTQINTNNNNGTNNGTNGTRYPLLPNTTFPTASPTITTTNTGNNQTTNNTVGQNTTPSFQQNILPFLQQKCLSCHQGYASLATAKEVTLRSTNGIMDRINRQPGQAGFMPQNGQPMSLDEKSLFTRWRDAGFPEFAQTTQNQNGNGNTTNNTNGSLNNQNNNGTNRTNCW